MAFKARSTTKYNETFFRGMGGPGPLAFGLIAVILVVAGLYMAFVKEIPFTSPGYQLKAEFSNAVNIRAKSPVRIAGVNVGEVRSVQREGDHSVVTFTVSDPGRPVRADAGAQIRPRIFLEGNFFIDLDPGSPSAPELEDGGTIPITRTATSVQLDELLTALQSDDRANLQQLLQGFGTALQFQPTTVEDLTQDPLVKGLTAAEAINLAFQYGGQSNRDTAIVSQALQGTEPNDLSKLIRGGGKTFKALASREEDLKGLITNLNIFTGALASESANLSNSIRLLPPTLEQTRASLVSLNETLPPLRAYATALEPGVGEIQATIDAAEPWLAQAKPLLSKSELGGTASLLRKSAPGLGEATYSTIKLLPKVTTFGKCVSRNLIPTGNVKLQDVFGAYDFSSGVENYKEGFYTAVNFAGESQNFDGNGFYLRAQPGGGPFFVGERNPHGANGNVGGTFSKSFYAKQLYGFTIAQPLATRPALTSQGLPPLNRKATCYKQDLPNLNGPAAAAGAPSPVYPAPVPGS